MASPLSVDGRRRLRLRHGLRDGSAHVRREVIFHVADQFRLHGRPMVEPCRIRTSRLRFECSVVES